MNDCENEIATETFLQSVQLYSFQNCTFDDGLENVSSIDTKKMILSRHLISDEGYFGSWKSKSSSQMVVELLAENQVNGRP